MTPEPEEQQGEALISRVLGIRAGELVPLLSSAFLFFSILCAIKIVRALRETASTIAGIENLADWWTWTFAFTVVANLAYWKLVNHLPRRRFVPWSLHACAACLLGFWALLRGTSGDAQYEVVFWFYVWFSAFNLCVVSLFWVCMVDQWTTEQGRRLFGLIGIGGTLGAILGSLLADGLVDRLGEAGLFLVAAGAIEFAVLMNAIRERTSGSAIDTTHEVVAGAGVFEGMQLVFSRRTLTWFAVLIVLMTAAQGGFYFLQTGYVREFVERADRTSYYAQKEVLADSVTLFLQIFVVGRVVRWLGVGTTLSIVPVFAIFGLAVFLVSPELSVLLIVHALWDAGRHGLLRPAREVVFTRLGAEAKYKSKTFLDSFLYRGGDVVWARFFDLFGSWNVIGWVTVPFAVLWAAVGPFLGRSHRKDAPMST